MANILEINNWNQLVSAKSDYSNLKIIPTQYNSEDITGTKISIVDYNNNDTYLVIFVKDIQSTIIPETCSVTPEQAVTLINNFGFNVRLSEPTVIANDVIELLKGLYSQGYRYVYKDYHDHKNKLPYAIYVSDLITKRKSDLCVTKMPSFIEDEWDWCLPLLTYPIKNIIDTGTVDNGSN